MKTVRIGPTEIQSAAAGARLGSYRIVRHLGQGGMGLVYEAEEAESGRHVALKVLSHGLDSHPARERFRREGLLAASINHPNTVYVFGTEEINGQPVIAMELVSGGTLQDRVERAGPMPVAEAVDAILQVIAGLEAAAGLGVLHRDIKPSNCFLDADGTVKVGDFGLSISGGSGDQSKLTLSGSFLGTPAYAPPEQLRGDVFTLQGDLYAVGATLHYLLTGRTPFPGNDLVRMLATVLERPAESPSKHRPELPAGLCAVVLRCLEKQPTKRFGSHAELRAVLLPFGSAAPTPAPLSLRFLAGFIDWILLASAGVSMTLLSAGHWDALLRPDTYPTIHRNVAAVGFVLTLLYFSLLEGLWGASIGKRLLGLRVTGPDRGRPGVLRAFLRATIAEALPALPLLLLTWFAVRPRGTTSFDPALLVTLLLFSTARRRNGFAALQDLLSRTRVFRRPRPSNRPRIKGVEAPVMTEAIPSQYGPYCVSKALASRGEEEILSGFDVRLRRQVWIRKLPPGSPPVEPSLRNLARVGRLRWLNGRRSPGACWDAYEAGPGVSLAQLLRDRRPWSQVRFWLLDLAEELAAAARDQTLPAVLNFDRVWVLADGRAKLLDFAAPSSDGPGQETPGWRTAGVADPGEGPRGFLSGVAVAALEGRTDSRSTLRPAEVAVPLPPHAREVLAGLQKGGDAMAFAERLRDLMDQLASVSPGRRLAALVGGFTLPIVVVLLWLTYVVVLVTVSQTESESIELIQCLQRLSEPVPTRASAAEMTMDRQTREAFEVYVVGHFQPMIRNQATWTSFIGATALRLQRSAAEQVVAGRAAPTEPELRQASETVRTYLDRQRNWPLDLVSPWGRLRPRVLIDGIAMVVMIGSVVPSLIAAFVFRGGLVLRILGLRIVRQDGRKASRPRILWRSLLAWGPLALLVLLATSVSTDRPDFTWKQASLLGLVVLPASGFLLWAALLPDRGLHDRMAGTALVPRE